MIHELLPASTALLHSLSRGRFAAAISVYVPADAGISDIQCCFDERRAGLAPTEILLRATLSHLRAVSIELAAAGDPGARAYACFTQLGGSVQDDLWLTLAVPVPIQLYIDASYRLAPLASALERSHPPLDMPAAAQCGDLMASGTRASARPRAARQGATAIFESSLR